MARKPSLVTTGPDLRNVIHLGCYDGFNSLHFKRVKLGTLTKDESSRLVTFEACKNRMYRSSGCSCPKPCIWAIVKMTTEERKTRAVKLREIYPQSKF